MATTVTRPRRPEKGDLNNLLGLGINVRGGFIQKKNARLTGQCACNRNQLLLPHRQARAALTQQGVITLLQLPDEVVAMGRAGRCFNRFLAECASHGNVVAHRASQ